MSGVFATATIVANDASTNVQEAYPRVLVEVVFLEWVRDTQNPEASQPKSLVHMIAKVFSNHQT